MKKLEQDIEKVVDKLNNIENIQIEMQADLKYHIKRTDLLETQVKPMTRVFDACKIIVPLLAGILLFKEQIMELLK